MTDRDKKQAREWIRNWEELGPILERVRLDSLKNVDTAESIAALDIAYKSARLHLPSRKTSGLIEQQRLFMRARR